MAPQDTFLLQPPDKASLHSSHMATTTHLSSLFIPKLTLPRHRRATWHTVSVKRLRHVGGALRTMAMSPDLLGDFGARDPFPAEIASNFGEKVLGAGDTEHKILIPNISALSLSQLECSPVSPLQTPMDKEDATKLLKKIIGWRLLDEEDRLKLQCLWKLRDFQCGVELVNRIYKAVESSGHFPDLHIEQPNQVRAELWTESIGGLSMNDFIIAAKIDEIKTSDLTPRKRIWA